MMMDGITLKEADPPRGKITVCDRCLTLKRQHTHTYQRGYIEHHAVHIKKMMSVLDVF